jgi:hypothetical protein
MVESVPNPNHQPVNDPVTGRFPPGNNASPRGRGTIKDKIKAEAAALVSAFQATHGRQPSPPERSRIELAADFAVNARRALPPEDKVKLSNSAERMLRRLGLDRIRVRRSETVVPNGPNLRAAIVERVE